MKKPRSRRKRKNVSGKQLTDEQINMFIWGAESFFTTSLVAEEEFIKNLYPILGDTRPGEIFSLETNLYYLYGLLNTISSNFGMALELKLKCIQYLTRKEILRDHILVDLFDCLNQNTQSILSEYYQEWIVQRPYEKKIY